MLRFTLKKNGHRRYGRWCLQLSNRATEEKYQYEIKRADQLQETIQLRNIPIVNNKTACFSDSLGFIFPRWFVILGHRNGFKIPRGQRRENGEGRH